MNEMMPDTGSFSSTGALDENFLRKHARYMGVARNVALMITLYFAATILLLWSYLKTRDVVLMVLSMLALVMMCWRPMHYYRRWLKHCVARLKETSPEGQEVITVSCVDQGVRVENQTSGGATTIAYGSIAKAVETDDTVFVLTKAQQMTAFFKSSLTEMECSELLEHLRRKGVRVEEM